MAEDFWTVTGGGVVDCAPKFSLDGEAIYCFRNDILELYSTAKMRSQGRKDKKINTDENKSSLNIKLSSETIADANTSFVTENDVPQSSPILCKLRINKTKKNTRPVSASFGQIYELFVFGTKKSPLRHSTQIDQLDEQAVYAAMIRSSSGSPRVEKVCELIKRSGDKPAGGILALGGRNDRGKKNEKNESECELFVILLFDKLNNTVTLVAHAKFPKNDSLDNLAIDSDSSSDQFTFGETDLLCHLNSVRLPSSMGWLHGMVQQNAVCLCLLEEKKEDNMSDDKVSTCHRIPICKFIDCESDDLPFGEIVWQRSSSIMSVQKSLCFSDGSVVDLDACASLLDLSVISAVTVHPTDPIVVLGDEMGKIHWLLATGTDYSLLKTDHWHPHPVSSLCFSANAEWLFSGGEEGVLVLWPTRKTGPSSLPSLEPAFLPRLGGAILSISAIDASTGGLCRYLNHKKKMTMNLTIAVCTTDNKILIVDVGARHPVACVFGLSRPLYPITSVCASLKPKPTSNVHRWQKTRNLAPKSITEEESAAAIKLFGFDICEYKGKTKSGPLFTLRKIPKYKNDADCGVQQTCKALETGHMQFLALDNDELSPSRFSSANLSTPPALISLPYKRGLQVGSRHKELVSTPWQTLSVAFSSKTCLMAIAEERRVPQEAMDLFASTDKTSSGSISCLTEDSGNVLSANGMSVGLDRIVSGASYRIQFTQLKIQGVDEETPHSLSSSLKSSAASKITSQKYSPISFAEGVHTAPITKVCVHPVDPKNFISVSLDGSWRLWELTTISDRKGEVKMSYANFLTGSFNDYPILDMSIETINKIPYFLLAHDRLASLWKLDPSDLHSIQLVSTFSIPRISIPQSSAKDKIALSPGVQALVGCRLSSCFGVPLVSVFDNKQVVSYPLPSQPTEISLKIQGPPVSLPVAFYAVAEGLEIQNILTDSSNPDVKVMLAVKPSSGSVHVFLWTAEKDFKLIKKMENAAPILGCAFVSSNLIIVNQQFNIFRCSSRQLNNFAK